jgi:hypothetical protein
MSNGPDACTLGAQKEITKMARREQKDFFIGTTEVKMAFKESSLG